MGSSSAADRLTKAALKRFHVMPQTYMGIDIRVFERDIQAYVNDSRTTPALIRLQVSSIAL